MKTKIEMMSNTRNCVCRHRNRHFDILIIFFLFLLLSSLTHNTIPIVEGRPISNLTEASQKLGQVDEESKAMVIGSRPPRCVRRCTACARCEAVQVPLAPQHRLPCTDIVSSSYSSVRSRSRSSSLRHGGTTSEGGSYSGDGDSVRYYYARSDEFSNYKPISWKCKCGNLLFNP